MPLSTGTKLGSYEILAPLGAGGMGEVYRANDTKLDREVAIKVLPTAFAQHPERLARFEREAKVLASLNHPNIATIYAVEESPEGKALVMELVKGQTLKGPVPLDTALKYAAQIASALDAAHEKGITHRDLKPANIMVTPDGTIKVLDFGLAAVTQPSRDDGEIGTNMATLTMSPTSAGMIMGTAAYMSPEQASGQTVERRADIWAFGVVLWELLTGKQLFGGTTVSHILASVLKDEPDFTQVPYKVRRLLRRCLEKDPQKRLSHIGAAMELVEVDAEAAPVTITTAAQSRFGKLPWVAAVAVTVLAVGLGVGLYRATRPAELKPLVRLDVDLGADTLLNSSNSSGMALSPDGTRLAYIAHNKLFTRKLDQAKATELPGTDGAFQPFFSPDGEWLAFFTSGSLKKISVEGGSPITICDATFGRGGSWGEDGNIIAALGSNQPLSRIPAAGGTPTSLWQLAPGETSNRWPQILPGGNAVLVTVATNSSNYDDASIEAMTLRDHRRKILQRGGTFGRYLPTSGQTGHLVYVNRGALFAVAFDPEKLETHGTPVPVVDQFAYLAVSGVAALAFADGRAGVGTLIYQSGGPVGAGQRTIQWLDSSGKTQPLLTKPDTYLFPRLSPDGERVAVVTTDVWVYEARRDTMSRLSFDGGSAPFWTPDGRYIIYRKLSEGLKGLMWTRADGAGKPQLLLQSNNTPNPTSFTLDGKRLAFQAQAPGTGYDLWTLPIETDASGPHAGKPEPFLQTQSNERNPTFSPDGRWLAYSSDESGKFEIYVRAFPDKGSKWQISSGGGIYPIFSRNGRELFFRTEDGRATFVASYTVKQDTFLADKPRVWSDKQIADLQLSAYNYDVAPDGKRIAALFPVESPEGQQSRSHVIFLENFFDELKRKVPVGK